MNTFQKFCPNVWVAKCEKQHEKGDVIEVTNRYGDAKEHIVFNLVGRSPDGLFYFYSIVRADGWNVQERAKAKAD
ncbi:hypothetical protein, partial [Propionibacterium freudenreichii]|uniref:hypothetical protein n=1 Tax=Propionibacterium freudenreichii TaxID=1744 RepID=UPI003853BDA3